MIPCPEFFSSEALCSIKSVGQIFWKHGTMSQVLTDAGLKISEDISKETNRIKTGRLKKSYRPKLIRRGL